MEPSQQRKSIGLPDGSMWITHIGPDRQLREDNPGINAIATVSIRKNGTVRRENMREDDFRTMGDNGTPEMKKFASEALSELQDYEGNVPGGADAPQIRSYQRPETSMESAPATPVLSVTNTPPMSP